MSNSGGNISLAASVRSCRVDSGWAPRLASDRFLNPNLMLCPVWQGVDTSGRPACADSYYTKTPGCSSAADRVLVENALRPQYMEYVTLDAQGIQGGLDCGVQGYYQPDERCGSSTIQNVHNYTGQFGNGTTDFRSSIQPNCLSCQTGTDNRAVASQNMRNMQMGREGFRSMRNRQYM
jgi:hypothetical protein